MGSEMCIRDSYQDGRLILAEDRINSKDSEDMSRYPKEVREALSGVKYVADHLKNTDKDNMVIIKLEMTPNYLHLELLERSKVC